MSDQSSQFTSPHAFNLKQALADDDEVYGLAAPYGPGAEFRITWAEVVSGYLAPQFQGLFAAVSHTHQLSDISELGALAAKDAVTDADIDAAGLSLDRISGVPPGVLLGRLSAAGSGEPTPLQKADILGLLNVEDGAQANPSGVTVVDLINTTLGQSDWQTGGGSGGGGAVQTVFGRTGSVIPLTGDYNADQIETAGTTNKFVTQAELDRLDDALTATDFDDTASVVFSVNAGTGAVSAEVQGIQAGALPAIAWADVDQANDKLIVLDASDPTNPKTLLLSELPTGGGSSDVIKHVFTNLAVDTADALDLDALGVAADAKGVVHAVAVGPDITGNFSTVFAFDGTSTDNHNLASEFEVKVGVNIGGSSGPVGKVLIGMNSSAPLRLGVSNRRTDVVTIYVRITLIS